MRHLRLGLVALLFVLVLFGTDLNSSAEEKKNKTYSPWAETYIRQGFQEEIIHAGSDYRIFEDWTLPCTRAMFSKFAVRLYEKKNGKIEQPMQSSFTDTKDVELIKAHHLGLIRGRSPRVFDPEAFITREEAAIMLARLTQVMGPIPMDKIGSFRDIKDLSPESQGGIKIVSAILDQDYRPIMRGMEPGIFGPKLLYTREQAMATLMRLSWAYDDNKARSRVLFKPELLTLPKAARDYAYDYTLKAINYYEDVLGFKIKHAEITELKHQNTGVAALDWTVHMYLLEYRLLPEQDENLKKLVDTKAVDGYITESRNGSQPYLLLLSEDRAGETTWERIGLVTTDKIKSQYSTEEMLKEYGNNPLTAASMEALKMYRKLKENK